MNQQFPYTVIDLTHALKKGVPSWNGKCGFYDSIKLDYGDCLDVVKFRVQNIKLHAGIGTHLDAPSHCNIGGKNVGELPLTSLIRPSICIDSSSNVSEDYLVQMQDVYAFEKKHGKIGEGSFVVFHTGWSKFWEKDEEYHNKHKFPTISEEVALYLVEQNVAGLGIDTLSPDLPSSGFPVHKHLLGCGKYIVENIANAHMLPKNNYWTLALPLKASNLTEAPMRLIALLPKKNY